MNNNIKYLIEQGYVAKDNSIKNLSKKYLQKAKNNLNSDQTIINLSKFYDQKCFDILKDVVKHSNNVYFLIEKNGLITYPYKQDNLKFLQ